MIFLVGDPYKTSFPLLLGGGGNPIIYHDSGPLCTMMSHAVPLCTMMYHVPCIDMYWCIDTPEWFSMHFGATPIPNILRINPEDHYRHAMLDLLWGKIGKQKNTPQKKHTSPILSSRAPRKFILLQKDFLFKTEISGSPKTSSSCVNCGAVTSPPKTSPFRTNFAAERCNFKGQWQRHGIYFECGGMNGRVTSLRRGYVFCIPCVWHVDIKEFVAWSSIVAQLISGCFCKNLMSQTLYCQ